MRLLRCSRRAGRAPLARWDNAARLAGGGARARAKPRPLAARNSPFPAPPSRGSPCRPPGTCVRRGHVQRRGGLLQCLLFFAPPPRPVSLLPRVTTSIYPPRAIPGPFKPHSISRPRQWLPFSRRCMWLGKRCGRQKKC